MISIVCPTLRVGGLDLLCESLARQTNTDFELILADGIWKYRHEHIADRLAALPFPVRHLASGGVELSNYSRSINDAVVAARGETVLIIPDYSHLSADCLEIHARFHDENRGQKKCLASGYKSVQLPARHPCFPGYHPNIQDANVHLDVSPGGGDRYEQCITLEAERYERDLKSGLLDPVMWSLFLETPSVATIETLPVTNEHRLFDCEFSWRYCSLKNESYPVALWEEINGLDEDLDGSHLYQDQALGYRLNDAGWEYERTRGGELIIVDPRPVFASKRVLHRMALNQHAYEWKRSHGLPVNPHRDIRAERAARPPLEHVHV